MSEFENMVNNQNELEEKKKQKKSKDNDFQGVEIREYPNSALPSLIVNLLNNNFTVTLAKTGYYVNGFYGLNRQEGQDSGSVFFQETSDPNLFAFYDHKCVKVPIRTFEELVVFNAQMWGVYFKQSQDYKKPDSHWFPYMLEYGVLNITPPSK